MSPGRFASNFGAGDFFAKNPKYKFQVTNKFQYVNNQIILAFKSWILDLF